MNAAHSSPAPRGAGGYPFVVYDSALLVGRLLMVVIYLLSGVEKFQDIHGTAAAVASTGLPAATAMAIIAACAEIGGSVLIAVGWQTRPVALGLMVYTLITAYFFHDFWNMPPGPAHIDAFIHALKNLAMAGGFLMLFATGPGRISLDARAMR
jgi:putative oxidoreductase